MDAIGHPTVKITITDPAKLAMHDGTMPDSKAFAPNSACEGCESGDSSGSGGASADWRRISKADFDLKRTSKNFRAM
jgi:hypothetical protein